MAHHPRRLVLFRHAKSAWPEGTPDAQRPLADRGRRDAPAAGRWLREHVDEINLVVCSPAVRARQTWDLAAAELDADVELRHDEQLYDASVDDLLAVIHRLPDAARTVVLVGHNPGLEELVSLLSSSRQELKTSAIAVLHGKADWAGAEAKWATIETIAKPRG